MLVVGCRLCSFLKCCKKRGTKNKRAPLPWLFLYQLRFSVKVVVVSEL